MKKGMTEFGPLESRLLSWSQMTGQQCVPTSKVSETLRIPPGRVSRLFDRMARDGVAIQLTRGLYLLPEKLPPGGRWQPPVETALWHYLEAKQAKWQETGLAAFNHYGLSEQVANVVTVYNDKVSDRRFFGKLEAVFIKVKADRLGSAIEQEIIQGKPERRRIGTLARVVLDAVYDYSRFGPLPTAYRWIEERKTDKQFLADLVQCTTKYGNVASSRRIGWLLESLGVPERVWFPLKKALKKSSAFIPLDPGQPVKGATNKKWGVVENFTPKGSIRGK